jgi:hypothetical protein
LRNEGANASKTMVPGEITLLRQLQYEAPAGMRGSPSHFGLESEDARDELKLRAPAVQGGGGVSGELQIEVIRVSLHGATAETAMGIMQGSRFEDVKANLSALVRLREERGVRYPRLQIAFVGMKKNIDEFPDFVKLAADLGADSVTLSSMMERCAVRS